jgi:hypothetical protein
VLSTSYGFFATSLVYLSVSVTALVFIMREMDVRRQPDTRYVNSFIPPERNPIPVIVST